MVRPYKTFFFTVNTLIFIYLTHPDTHIQIIPWCVYQLQQCAVIANDEEWRHLWVIHTHHDVGRQLGWTTENAENMNNKGKTFSAIFYACLCGFSGNKWCGYCFWLLLFVYFFYIINAPFGSPVSKTLYCRIYRIIYVLIIITFV